MVLVNMVRMIALGWLRGGDDSNKESYNSDLKFSYCMYVIFVCKFSTTSTGDTVIPTWYNFPGHFTVLWKIIPERRPTRHRYTKSVYFSKSTSSTPYVELYDSLVLFFTTRSILGKLYEPRYNFPKVPRTTDNEQAVHTNPWPKHRSSYYVVRSVEYNRSLVEVTLLATSLKELLFISGFWWLWLSMHLLVMLVVLRVVVLVLCSSSCRGRFIGFLSY